MASTLEDNLYKVWRYKETGSFYMIHGLANPTTPNVIGGRVITYASFNKTDGGPWWRYETDFLEKFEVATNQMLLEDCIKRQLKREQP